jgi:hypothetical protein
MTPRQSRTLAVALAASLAVAGLALVGVTAAQGLAQWRDYRALAARVAQAEAQALTVDAARAAAAEVGAHPLWTAAIVGETPAAAQQQLASRVEGTLGPAANATVLRTPLGAPAPVVAVSVRVTATLSAPELARVLDALSAQAPAIRITRLRVESPLVQAVDRNGALAVEFEAVSVVVRAREVPT